MTAVPLPTQETMDFLERFLPKREARILEVGCGEGDLARALADRGHSVTALDKSAEMVQAARRKGLRAVEGDFLLYHDSPFEVLIFSRSLHHIHPLDEALDRARALLAPGGLALFEEFAHDLVDRPTARWLYDTASLLEAAGLLQAREWDCPQVADPLERWREEKHFDPPLHTGAAMQAGIRARFEWIEGAEAPYLYRHLVDRLVPGERGPVVARRLLPIESRLIAERVIRAIGVRMAARRQG